MNQSNQSVKTFFKSFVYAKKGIVYVLKHERNFKVHILFTLVVLIAGFALNWGALKWSLIILSIALVLTLEMVNSAIEYSWNHLEPHHHPVVGTIKDVMAGAVLIGSCAAAGVGLLVVFGHF